MNKPIVFADYHHSGLFYSLKLLIEDRLGGTLFRPVGMEWFDRGYWAIAEPYKNDINTIKQYLWIKSDFKPVDGTSPLNTVINKKPTHFEVQELDYNYIQKAITWDQFMSTNIDILVASIPRHWTLYQKLAEIHPSHPKLICQMGNIDWDEEHLIKEGQVKNLLASVKEFRLPRNINAAFYHQEMKLRDYKEPPTDSKIKSFVHLLPKRDTYNEYKEALSGEVEFKAYGSLAPDGYCNGVDKVYDEIQDSSLVWNIKPRGDGFGHIWHSAFMLGRPVITNFSDYKDKLGGLLFEDLQTGIDLEKRSFEENIELIRLLLKERYLLLEMSRNAFATFRQIVDYDVEEKKLRKFFDNLI